MAHIILFDGVQFQGSHKHVVAPEPNLDDHEDNFFNDKVSSFVVLQGNWALYADSNFRRQYRPIVGPGLYPSLPEGINSNDLSSLRPVMESPTAFGKHFDSVGHIILFEHTNFHGRHKHVFTIQQHFDDFFNDKLSSCAVIAGNWRFFKHSNSVAPYPVVVGPPQSDDLSGVFSPGPVGGIPDVQRIGIENDKVSSLRPESIGSVSVSSVRMHGHVLLFEHANFRGAHKHVFDTEPDLKAPDDNFFNDKVSSIAVLFGGWQFFKHKSFEGPYPTVLRQSPDLTPGLTPSVQSVGIKNDDMSSLWPVG